jgi:hypothetical protein
MLKNVMRQCYKVNIYLKINRSRIVLKSRFSKKKIKRKLETKRFTFDVALLLL